MAYLVRDAEGRVVGVSEVPLVEGAEPVAEDDPEVQAFLIRVGGRGDDSFIASDLAFIRVIEDLVEVLVQKRALALTDLPVAAQEKLLGRRVLRGWLSDITDMAVDGGKII